MTTITAISGNKLTVRPSSTSDAHIALECADHDGRQFHGARVYQRKDLLAAFGIDELGCGCEEADENLDAALKRAEAAEAEALEQAGLVRTFADRAEAAEAKLAEAERDLRLVRAEVQQIKLLEAEEHRRAEAAEAEVANSEPRALCNELRDKLAEANRRRHTAEAAVQRVRDLDWFGHYSADYVRGLIAKALDPVPPFTLPTTVPATIKATNKGDGRTVRLDLWTDGDGSFVWDTSAYGRYTPEGVLEHFTGHRLIGADE